MIRRKLEKAKGSGYTQIYTQRISKDCAEKMLLILRATRFLIQTTNALKIYWMYRIYTDVTCTHMETSFSAGQYLDSHSSPRIPSGNSFPPLGPCSESEVTGRSRTCTFCSRPRPLGRPSLHGDHMLFRPVSAPRLVLFPRVVTTSTAPQPLRTAFASSPSANRLGVEDLLVLPDLRLWESMGDRTGDPDFSGVWKAQQVLHGVPNELGSTKGISCSILGMSHSK